MSKLPYLMIGKFLLLVLLPLPSNAIGLWDLITAGKDFLILALNTYNSLEEDNQKLTQTDVEKLSPDQGMTLRKLDSIYWDLGDLKNDIKNWQVREDQKDIASKIDEMMSKVNKIDQKYEAYKRFRFNNTFIVNNKFVRAQPKIIKDFAESVISFRNGELSEVVADMYAAFIGIGTLGHSVLSQLSQNTRTDLMCIRNQSAQQFILELFRILIDADMKALIIKLFAYDELAKYEDNNAYEHPYEYSRIAAQEDFVTRINNAKMQVKKNMIRASRVVWRCDPPTHQKNLTYTKIEVFQTYAYYERDYINGDCDFTCEHFSYSRKNPIKISSECKSKFCNKHSERKRCHGKLMDCKKIHKKQKYCFSPETSDRRYDWMLTGSHTTYGTYDISCEDTIDVKEIPYISLMPSEYPYAVMSDCDTCLCTCVSEERDIVRYFSMKPVYADVDKNMVVTGIRFVKNGNILSLQIQQGRLAPNGSIDQKSLEWKNETNSYGYGLYNVYEEHNTVLLDDILSPYEKNKNSNDLHEEFVVSGVKLEEMDNSLRLKVSFVPYNFTSGTIYNYTLLSHAFYGNDKDADKREKLSLADSADPTKTNYNLLDSKHQQRVEFQITGLKRDLGQSTIPYIDIQDVVTKPAVPLVGLGLMHKGTPGYGGFLGLKIIQYDYTQRL